MGASKLSDSPQRISELWFEDGNVILQAEQSFFRVYTGILSARSTVFRDMFSFPQPQPRPQLATEDEDEDTMEGCPLIVLHDNAEDVTHFLKAIYDSGFFEPAPAASEFAIISGVLRLSNKYDVEYLKRRALIHLCPLAPMTLKEFDKSRNQKHAHAHSQALDFASVSLAREVDALWMLPTLMYAVCQYPIEDILDGNINTLSEDTTSALRHGLSFNDIRTCLSARQALISITATKISRFLRCETITAGCTRPSMCRLWRFTLLNNGMDSLQVPTPLTTGSEIDWDDYAVHACEACVVAAKERQRADRQACWDKLPAVFGLPDWDMLTLMRKAAIGV